MSTKKLLKSLSGQTFEGEKYATLDVFGMFKQRKDVSPKNEIVLLKFQ